MKNITLAIDDEVLQQARDYAERNGTTVNAMVRGFFADTLAQEKRIEEARRGLLELMDNSTGRLGPNFKWNREEIYADRMFSGHQRPRLRRGREER